MMDDAQAFFTLHRNLPREGPGDRASLGRMLHLAGLRPDAAICDAGCGPGADIPALLAHAPQGRIDAVDLHAPFIGHLRARYALDPRVTAHRCDLRALPGQYDLIWSAGAVYAVGIGPALGAFRRALNPGGKIAFSHLCWLSDARPPEAVAFWAVDFPEMQDRAAVQRAIAATGAHVIASEVLADTAWQAYYGPLENRLDTLEGQAGDDPALVRQIAAHRQEIAVWRTAQGAFGYVLWLVTF